MESAAERDFCVKMMKDSQHEVLLPAWQVAPDSDGGALHILDFESHISVELLCRTERDRDTVILELEIDLLLKCCYISKHLQHTHTISDSVVSILYVYSS